MTQTPLSLLILNGKAGENPEVRSAVKTYGMKASPYMCALPGNRAMLRGMSTKR